MSVKAYTACYLDENLVKPVVKKRKSPVPAAVGKVLVNGESPQGNDSLPPDDGESADEAPVKLRNKLRWALMYFGLRASLKRTSLGSFAWPAAMSIFTSQAEGCTRRPKQQWETYQLNASRARQGLPALATSPGPSPAEAESAMMDAFVKRGIEHPGDTRTLPPRASRVDHILPPTLKAKVSHQTVRDLKILHDALDEKVTNGSKFSIATLADLGTTSNMVNAFCGITITSIDKNWVLHEHVLDLVPLRGDAVVS
ncbi:hypothetical protein C8R47DRAFT_1320324 [Mycena vitilis]|nr:hypothetical protein C8R47DRAFT_1320323 [Mycena vitilis]KAJ6489281.1 hypothetical protein C8R47DRAFT_1320324 [Mycena vitilis]